MTDLDMDLEMEMESAGELNMGNGSEKKGKLRRSCEFCRTSKGKCVPSEEMGRCQRCLKDGKQCVFLTAKPRPKRAKTSRLRVAEMEEKLEGLLALLSQKGIGEPPPLAPLRPSSPPTPPLDTPAESPPIELDLSSLQSSFGPSTPQYSLERYTPHNFPLFTFPPVDNFQDVISRNIVSYEQAEESLRVFRTKIHIFPFVVLPTSISLDSLRRQKPVLLLSILALGADSNAAIQSQLELEMRENFARRIMVNCEKSLDLLQGLLVYLAWYHYYFDPEREQINQLCRTIATMVVDLGMDKIRQEYHSIISGMISEQSLIFPPKVTPEDLEAKRTFLGSYYLCASISQGLRKPSALKHTAYMDECAQTLAQASIVQSDYLIPYFIRLQKLSDEVRDVFDYDGEPSTNQEAMPIEILVQSYTNQIKQFEESFTPEIWKNTILSLGIRHLKIYASEICFHAPPPSDLDLLTHLPSRTWHNSPFRSTHLVTCLQSTKSYLDTFLSLPNTSLLETSLTEWLRLTYSILILGAFSTHPSSTHLSPSHLHSLANMDTYLDSLTSKFASCISELRHETDNGYVSHLRYLFQKIKLCYWQLKVDPTCPNVALSFSFMEILPTVFRHCEEWANEEGRGGEMEEWGTLVGWGGEGVDVGAFETF